MNHCAHCVYEDICPKPSRIQRCNRYVKSKAKHKADVKANWIAIIIVTIMYAVWYNI